MKVSFVEAIKAMYEGKRITKINANHVWYRYSETLKEILNQDGHPTSIPVSVNLNEAWYILDDSDDSTEGSLATQLKDVFNRFQRLNLERCNDAFFPLYKRAATYYSSCVAEEAGEVCSEVNTLINLAASRCEETNEEYSIHRQLLGRELADLITYAFLLAEFYKITLSDVFISKFNEVSKKKGSNIRIE